MSIPPPTEAPRRPATAAAAVRRRQRPRRLPDPAAEGPRQAARLPRQRRHDAEAAGRPRRAAAATTRTTTPTSTAASTSSASGPRAPSRRPASRCSASSTPPAPREIIFTRGTTEGINLVAQSFGRTHLQPGDEILVSRDGAPLQHRPLADALRGRPAPRCASSRSTTPASCCSTSSRSCSAPRTKLVVGRPRVQLAGHDQPGRARSSSWPTRAACRC